MYRLRPPALEVFIVCDPAVFVDLFPFNTLTLGANLDSVFLPNRICCVLCGNMSKRTRGKTLNSQSRELVIKLQSYFEREYQNGGPLIPLNRVQDRVADALEISRKTVSKINKEKFGPSGSEENKLHTPRKKWRKSSTMLDIDDFDSDAIRNHIYGYYTRNEYPTRAKLLVSLKEAGLFNGGKTTLSALLKKIGFKYCATNKRQILMERGDILLKRYDFLREARKITDWDNVVFLDETWLNANHTLSRIWTDNTSASTSKAPMGKGSRLIICHAGSAGNGFIENGLLAFQSKNTKDYHEEMDANTFKEWFTTQLLPSLAEPSIIIMDNAPYHSAQVEYFCV